MKKYSQFANVYDLLMGDVDYKKRTSYLLKLFKKYDKKPTLLLDLACGTGSFSLEMVKEGIEVIGVDMSEDMLSVAREKSAEEKRDILFLCQKAEELDLYGTVDGAICCMDSLNHITDPRNLKKAIKKVSLFMEADRLFIFDVNTPYKHEHILANETFVFEENEIFCVWQNKYNAKKGITDISLEFFEKKENDKYIRYSESFSERAYTEEKLKKVLTESGFETIAVLDDMTMKSPKENSDRMIFVARKKG